VGTQQYKMIIKVSLLQASCTQQHPAGGPQLFLYSRIPVATLDLDHVLPSCAADTHRQRRALCELGMVGASGEVPCADTSAMYRTTR